MVTYLGLVQFNDTAASLGQRVPAGFSGTVEEYRTRIPFHLNEQFALPGLFAVVQGSFAKQGVGFIEKQDPAHPFFLHVCYTAPHANNEMGRDTGDGMEVPSYGPYQYTDWPNPEKGFAAMKSGDCGKVVLTWKEG